MKTIQEIYPDLKDQEDDYFFGTGDYQPMIDEIANVLIQVDDSDYQGDSRVLYEKDGKYGYLIFGWGSCSGCDSLQACESMEQIQCLFNELVNDVKWFDTLELLKEYFANKDWELDYSWHSEETKQFVQKVLEYNSN